MDRLTAWQATGYYTQLNENVQSVEYDTTSA